MRTDYEMHWFDQLKQDARSVAITATTKTNAMIIKRVTQIHSSYERLGVFERVSLERWKALNPDVDHRFITDADIDSWIEGRWPQYVDLYRNMLPICRAGVQRLAVVLRWGGLYADCGTYPIRPIGKFKPFDLWDGDLVMFKLKDRDHQGMVSIYGPNVDTHMKLTTDCIFAAEQGHPFLQLMIDAIFARTAERNGSGLYVETDGTFRLRRWVFDTASVHIYSEVAHKHGIIPRDGLADAHDPDLIERPYMCNTYRYSTESWLKENRFVRDGVDKTTDELQNLNKLKRIYGI